MQDHRCPECGVSMESVEFGMSDAWNPHIKTGEKRKGLLGKLGVGETEDVVPLMGPDCGLLRFHADVDEGDNAY